MVENFNGIKLHQNTSVHCITLENMPSQCYKTDFSKNVKMIDKKKVTPSCKNYEHIANIVDQTIPSIEKA